MKDFCAITVELKKHIAKTKIKKVLDKDVANLLGISQMHFATIKKRNVTPYKNILKFCYKENISCNELFFESSKS